MVEGKEVCIKHHFIAVFLGRHTFHTKKAVTITNNKTEQCPTVTAFVQWALPLPNFHSNQHIGEPHPNDWKTRSFPNVTIARGKMEIIKHKEHQHYFCEIPNNNQILYVMMANLKVKPPSDLSFDTNHCPTDASEEITKH